MKDTILFVSDEKQESLNVILEKINDDNKQEVIFVSSLNGISKQQAQETHLILIKFQIVNNLIPGYIKQFKIVVPDLNIPIALFANTVELGKEILEEFLKLGIKDFFNPNEPMEIVKLKISDILQRERYRLQVEELKKQLKNVKNDEDITPNMLDQVSRLINDPANWDFMYRVITEGGPIHKNVVNECFLEIFGYYLAELTRRNQKEIIPYPFETLNQNSVNIHHSIDLHPPHPHHHPPAHYHPPYLPNDFNLPLGMPLRLLNVIYKNEKQKLGNIITQLFQGPAHEVFMNILCLHIFEQYYSLLHEGESNE